MINLFIVSCETYTVAEDSSGC